MVAIIQARMGSERLPGKVLLDIAGQTMLSRVVQRLRQSMLLDTIVVATTTSHKDDPIAEAAKELGVEVTRGSEDDVLDRYRKAAEEYNAATIVRVCADSPFIDSEVCDKVIAAFVAADPPVDYASNKLEPSFPLGLDVEVFSKEALDRAASEAAESFEKAHVTVHIYQNPSQFRLLPVTNERDLHSMRWTVDTPEDLEFARQLFARFAGGNGFSWREVVDIVEREPGLAAINGHLQPKHVTEG